MTEYDDPQLRIEELEDENSRLRWKLRESEQQKDFWEKRASDSLSFYDTKLRVKKYFRTALFSCYLGGIFGGAAGLRNSISQAGGFLDFFKFYGGLVLFGLLGLAGIGFLSFGVSNFFFEEERLPLWLWLLIFLIPPLLVVFYPLW